MAFIGSFSRALLESATAVYFGGVSVSILDAQGNVILGDDLPDAPTITSTIADRTYAVGDTAVSVDLRTKFSGATSYTVSPTNAAVTINDYTLTINPAAAMTSTSFTVRGVNGGGQSAPLAFTLTVTAPAPVLIQPFPDQSLLIGGGTVTLPLAQYFSGAAGYAVSPANSGVTISNGNLIISRTTARDVIISVTATNATGQDTSDSFALLIAAPANQAPVASAIPQQNPTANTAFSVDLSSYFVDPEGAALSYDYTGTLPTGITRNGAVFSGTATVTDQTASGVLRARDPGNLEAEAPVTWAVSAQPTITATVSPNPLVAGQPGTITFNTAPDAVTGNVTFTGTGTTRSFTAPSDDTVNVTIGATKAGYTAFSGVFDVSPAAPQITTTSANTAQISNIDTTTQPFSLTMTGPYAGTRTVTPSQMADGPVFHVAPSQSGTGAVGSEVLLDLGLVLNFASAGTAIVTWRLLIGGVEWQANGTSYTIAEADQGKSLVWEVTAEDANGERTIQTNAIAVPSAEAPSLLALNSTDRSWVNYAVVSSSPDSLQIQKAVTTVSVWSYQISFPIGTRIRMTLVTDHAISLRLGDNRDALNQVILGTYAAGTHQVDVVVDTLKPWFVIRAGNGSPAGTVTITNFHAA